MGHLQSNKSYFFKIDLHMPNLTVRSSRININLAQIYILKITFDNFFGTTVFNLSVTFDFFFF